MQLLMDTWGCKNEWSCTASQSHLNTFFVKNYLSFPRYAGDIESMLLHVKTNHALRLMCDDNAELGHVNMEDINCRFNDFIINRHNI